MPDKTKTVVVFESHEQTIIRRSRRTVSGQVSTDGAVGRASSDDTEPDVPKKPKSRGRWWKAFLLKSATVLAPLSRRLKAKANERKHKHS